MHGVSPYIFGGEGIIADSEEQTLMAVRENFKLDATQFKIMGVVVSNYACIHNVEPSPSEIWAAVQAAGHWGTYILAHVYTSKAFTQLVENSVKGIEHGLLIDDNNF